MQHVPGKFDGGQLHAVAKPKIRDLVLAAIPDGIQFTLYATRAKAAGNDNAVIIVEFFEAFRTPPAVLYILELARIEPLDLRLYAPERGAVFYGFDHRKIRIRQNKFAA